MVAEELTSKAASGADPADFMALLLLLAGIGTTAPAPDAVPVAGRPSVAGTGAPIPTPAAGTGPGTSSTPPVDVLAARLAAHQSGSTTFPRSIAPPAFVGPREQKATAGDAGAREGASAAPRDGDIPSPGDLIATSSASAIASPPSPSAPPADGDALDAQALVDVAVTTAMPRASTSTREALPALGRELEGHDGAGSPGAATGDHAHGPHGTEARASESGHRHEPWSESRAAERGQGPGPGGSEPRASESSQGPGPRGAEPHAFESGHGHDQRGTEPRASESGHGYGPQGTERRGSETGLSPHPAGDPRPDPSRRSETEVSDHRGADTAPLVPLPTLIEARSAQNAPPSTVAEAAPARPASEPPVVDQVVQVARLVVSEGHTRMEVRLEPPALGAVRVTADASAGSIHVTIAAEQPETRALLLQAVPELQAALSSRGVAAVAVAVAGSFDSPDDRRAPARREPDGGSRYQGPYPDRRRQRAASARPVTAFDLTI